MDTFDAILVPRGWRDFQDEEGLYREVVREYGAALGLDPADPDARLYMADVVTRPGMKFVRPDVNHVLKFHKKHPKYSGQDRYDWRLGDGGIMFGTLTERARSDTVTP